MRKLLFWLRLPDTEPAVRTFTAIVSETTHLPIGQEREFWDPAVLASKDVEIATAEAEWREDGLAACRRVIELLPPKPPAT